MTSVATYKLIFFFDYGCESCLWCENEAAYEKYYLGPIDSTTYDLEGNIIKEPKIIFPTEIKDKIVLLSKLFNSSLNWDNPKELEPTWTTEKQNEFDTKARQLYKEVCNFLGNDFDIIYAQL